ncbi:carboxymuconolactone decarboxylase family protein [Micrococcus luteus]
MSTESRSVADDREDPLRFYLDKASPDVWDAMTGLRKAVAAYAKEAELDAELVELVSLRISQINGCAYCLDVHTRLAEKAGVSTQRLSLLPAWEEAGDVYSPQEKAALRLAETVTLLPEHEEQQVAQMLSHADLTDAQYAAVQWVAVAMNATNRISIMSHHPVKARS